MRDRSRVTTRALTRYDASSPIALGCYGDQRVTSSVLRCRVPPTPRCARYEAVATSEASPKTLGTCLKGDRYPMFIEIRINC